MITRRIHCLGYVAILSLAGCDAGSKTDATPPPAETTAETRPTELPPTSSLSEKPKAIATQGELEAAIKAKNPGFGGAVETGSDGVMIRAVQIQDATITDISPLAGMQLMAVDLRGCRRLADISPLKGMPLEELYLEETSVSDIGPLRGMPLKKLYLSRSKVSDIRPLQGAPLVELNAIDTQVSDLTPLTGSRLQMLWLSNTPVRDISPLARVPLVSLTLEGTKVADLSPLKGHPIQRLQIVNTQVSDLGPLQWMRLSRLVFTPGRIKNGLEHARKMDSLTEIGATFEERMPPGEFWKLYDAGKIK